MLGFAAVIGPGGVVDKAKSDDLAFHLTLTRLLTLFSVLLRSTYSLRASDCASPSSLRQLVRELGGRGGGRVSWASPPRGRGDASLRFKILVGRPQKSRLLKKIFEIFTNFRFPNISKIK